MTILGKIIMVTCHRVDLFFESSVLEELSEDELDESVLAGNLIYFLHPAGNGRDGLLCASTFGGIWHFFLYPSCPRWPFPDGRFGFGNMLQSWFVLRVVSFEGIVGRINSTILTLQATFSYFFVPLVLGWLGIWHFFFYSSSPRWLFLVALFWQHAVEFICSSSCQF